MFLCMIPYITTTTYPKTILKLTLTIFNMISLKIKPVEMKNFNLKLHQRNISEQDMIEDLIKVTKKLTKQTLTRIDYDEHGHFGATTFARKFGSWNKALIAAGLNLNCRINIPNEELFENLANIWLKLGQQPVGNDIIKPISKFSLGTYEKRFRSWNKALLAFDDYIKNPNIFNIATDKEVFNDPSPSHRTPRKINWRLRATVLIRDNCICRMCGASPAKDSSITLHADHINPWSAGGETTTDNLQTLCHICNIGKSNIVF